MPGFGSKTPASRRGFALVSRSLLFMQILPKSHASEVWPGNKSATDELA
jgi:hypothetical protein